MWLLPCFSTRLCYRFHMSLEELKTQLAELPKDRQDEIAAYLVHLRHLRSPEIAAEISSKIDDNDSANWLTLDQLREQWKD